MNRYIKNSHGFTLIEVMITVAIIAILTAIAIPAYDGYIKAARITEAKNNIAALKLAEEEYFLENNSYFYKEGTNAELATASGNLWSASKGDGGTINFVYTVSDGGGTGYSITATGIMGTKGEGLSDSYEN